MKIIQKHQKAKDPLINEKIAQNPFKKLPALPPTFSFGELKFVETPRFPREIYRGQGTENLTLPQSDKEKNLQYFIVQDSRSRAVGAITLNPAKKIATYLFILPEERKKGYGLSVIDAFEDYARKSNWSEIKSHVPADGHKTLDILEERGWNKSGPYPSTHGKQFYIVKKVLQ